MWLFVTIDFLQIHLPESTIVVLEKLNTLEDNCTPVPTVVLRTSSDQTMAYASITYNHTGYLPVQCTGLLFGTGTYDALV